MIETLFALMVETQLDSARFHEVAGRVVGVRRIGLDGHEQDGVDVSTRRRLRQSTDTSSSLRYIERVEAMAVCK